MRIVPPLSHLHVLGLAQGLLGLCFAVCIPDVWLHHMRVGLGFLRYHPFTHNLFASSSDWSERLPYNDAAYFRRAAMPLLQTENSFNGHSMVGPLQRVLVCSPQTAGWDQPERVGQWRELGFHHQPDPVKAQKQHDTLRRELEVAGGALDLPPSSDLSLDAVYAHDASLATDFGLILMRPGKRTGSRKQTGIKVRRAAGHPDFGAIGALGSPRLAISYGSTPRRYSSATGTGRTQLGSSRSDRCWPRRESK